MEDWDEDDSHHHKQHRGAPRVVAHRRRHRQLMRRFAGPLLVTAACSSSLVLLRWLGIPHGQDNLRPHNTGTFFSTYPTKDHFTTTNNNYNLRETTARAMAAQDVTTPAAATSTTTDHGGSGKEDVLALQQESTEATDRAAAAAAELVDKLDAAREAADILRREAAAAAHKKRVADRAAAAAQHQQRQGSNSTTATSEFASMRERRVQLRDGTEKSFSVFGRSDEDVSVFVLPFNTQTKRFRLIEEYHPGPNRRMVGLVAGMYEAKHGGSPETAARWELSEEARLKIAPGVSRLVPLATQAEGGFSQDKYSSAHFRPFLALDCVDDDRPRPRDKEEDNIRLHNDVSVEDLRQMVQEGRLNMPSTAFALMGLQWLEEQELLV